jgi:hypothetical protein
MRLVIGLIILWLLIYQDAVLFKTLHSFILGIVG